MALLEDLPDTDMLRFAEPLGVDLEVISDRYDRDAVGQENNPGVFIEDPSRTWTTFPGSFAAALAAHPRAAVIVPIAPNRRRTGRPANVDPPVLAALAEQRAHRSLDALETAPCDYLTHHPGLLLFPTAPHSHPGHRSTARCELGRDAACWEACAEVVLASAASVAEHNELFRRRIIAPPLLAAPPAGISRARVADVLAHLGQLFGPLVTFAPHPLTP